MSERPVGCFHRRVHDNNDCDEIGQPIVTFRTRAFFDNNDFDEIGWPINSNL